MLALGLLVAVPSHADKLRIAFLNAELSRKGPGLLLAELRKGGTPQTDALGVVVAEVAPDVLVLAGVDYDHGLLTLSALADALAGDGAPAYPYRFALRPNTGLQTGMDMDADGRIGGPGDAQGFGYFNGADGLAILSRLPIDEPAVRDFSDFLWRDLPDNMIEETTLPPGATDIQRLAATGFWEVPLVLPDGRTLRILTYHATPPVFDGPEDRNGRRNHDETAFWTALLSGKLAYPPPKGPFVIAADTNLDPLDGNGRGAAMQDLLAHPGLIDSLPESAGGATAWQGDGQHGNPSLDTVDWPETIEGGPGNLRVDYLLPSTDLSLLGSGTYWPDASDVGHSAQAEVASRHRLIWIDLGPP